jgi:hypothetical protein
MSEHIQVDFDRLSTRAPAPPPPEAFLSAVAQRRRNRRLLRGSAGLAAGLAGAFLLFWMGQPQPAADRTARTIAGTSNPADPEDQIFIPTAQVLMQLNWERDPEEMILPAAARSGSAEPPVYLGISMSSRGLQEEIRRWR